MIPQLHPIDLHDSSQIGEARRMAMRAAHCAGMGETDCGRVSIIATELASNVIRHGQGGEILLGAAADQTRPAIELIAIDRGPGIRDLGRCMTDGYSSGASLGQGLGAIGRLSDAMDVYSGPGRGAAIYARIEAAARGAPASQQTPSSQTPSSWFSIRVPAFGEVECGDDCRVAAGHNRIAAAVADGLGHGPLAAKAALQSMLVFEQSPFSPPDLYLKMAHQALHSTRGAAVACARVDYDRGTMIYAGIGNISSSIIDNHSHQGRSLPSYNGTVGLQIGQVRQFEYPVRAGDLLVMHSDGLTARWKPSDYPGLWSRIPALVAAVLYRDLNRKRDDATVLVVRLQ